MQISNPEKDHICDLVSIWKEAFGDDEQIIKAFFDTAFSLDKCLVAIEKGIPVSALYWIDAEYSGEKVAYLYAIATKAEYRKKGFCKALLTEAHSRLKAQGYAAAILVPDGESLFSFYSKFGYEAFGGISEFLASSSSEEINLSKISKDEYALLRRKMLPKGSVIQEGKGLSYLAAQAEFFKGESCIMAAHVSKHRLFAYELLGDVSKAGAILNHFKLPVGSFRCPGRDKLFAMILPLSPAVAANPEYFAFAFD